MKTTQLKPRFPQTVQLKGTWVFQNTESSRAAQENPHRKEEAKPSVTPMQAWGEGRRRLGRRGDGSAGVGVGVCLHRTQQIAIVLFWMFSFTAYVHLNMM